MSADGTSVSHAPRDAAELADVVRDALARGATLAPRGAGTWSEVRARTRGAEPVELRAMTGVLAYTPGDLTISVGAGTTLRELDEATRPNGQWCPLLAWGDDAGTVGATVATATAGPCAAALGRPRDLAIGLECVDGTGRVVRAGGRVVKNVAGFDLVRLMTGQWGTLGVITMVDLRLRARPALDETLLLTLGDATVSGTPSGERLRALMRGPYAPLACVQRGNGRWLLRIGGNETFVRAASAAFRALGSMEPRPSSDWDDVRRGMAPVPALGAWRWDALSRRIKERFDPKDILNPGLLGGSTAEGAA